MEKKNKSFEITMIICILAFSGILYGIYLLIDMFTGNKDYLLFINPYNIIDCDKWECNNVSDKLNSLNSKKYKIYFDGNYMGAYDLYYNNVNKKFYVFDDTNNNILKDDYRFFAYSGNANIVQKSYEFLDIDSSEYDSLKNLIDLKFYMANVSKVNYDFDNDNEVESLFVINSPQDSGDYGPRLFNVLVYKDSDKYTVLDKKELNDSIEAGSSYISNVIDIFDDDKVEFIYTTTFLDETGTCSVIYRLKGNKFVNVNECEIVR